MVGSMGVPRWAGNRALAADLVLAGALALFVVGSAHWWASFQHPDRHHLEAPGYALMVVASAALAGRRVWPAAATAVTAIATALYLAGKYPYGPFFAASVIAVYSLSARVSAWRSLGACGVVLALYLAADVSAAGLAKGLGDGMPWALMLLVPWTA